MIFRLFAGLCVICVAAAGVFTANGCRKGTNATDKLSVVVTTTMVGDLVKRIAGDKVNLTVMMGPGVDPHTYKPSTGDFAAVKRADLVFYSGLHLEGKMVEVFEKQLGEKATAVSKDIPHEKLLAWDGQDKAHDPHIWFDVMLWSRAGQTVMEKLSAADPKNAETYKANHQTLLAEMTKLDAYARTQIGTIPERQRVLITSHDAYGYFGRAYGIEVRGIQGISTEAEAGTQSVASAVSYIVERKIPSVFVESSVSKKTIEAVQQDAKRRGMDVVVGGELFSDAMGAPGEKPGYAVETYDGMVRYNVDTIVKGLTRK